MSDSNTKNRVSIEPHRSMNRNGLYMQIDPKDMDDCDWRFKSKSLSGVLVAEASAVENREVEAPVVEVPLAKVPASGVEEELEWRTNCSGDGSGVEVEIEWKLNWSVGGTEDEMGMVEELRWWRTRNGGGAGMKVELE